MKMNRRQLLPQVGYLCLVSDLYWTEDAQGYNIGSHGLCLKPRDMAKFGYLYLNQGLWDGEQIVPSDYVQASTQKQIGVDFFGTVG